MTSPAVVTAFVLLGTAILLTKPLGLYMTRVFQGERTFLSRLLQPVESLIYGACRIDPDEEQHWASYAIGLLVFGFACALFLFVLFRLQGVLPLNPQGFDGIPAPLAFNMALSFISPTNWQALSPEQGVSHLSQMIGVAVQNFAAAAVGTSVAIALIRGLTRRTSATIGNCWVDLTRATLYIFLPIAALIALFFIWQGVPQNLRAAVDITTLEGGAQSIAQGPVASQEAIKTFGTNGGGFFNANSAHPYENPNHWTNLIQMIAMLAVPSAMTYVFGKYAGETKKGWALLAVMVILFASCLAVTQIFEQDGNPRFEAVGISQEATSEQAGGNMEGKETRFGIVQTSAFTNASVASSTGATSSAMSSMMPIASIVPIFYMVTGQAVFGGTGVGLVSMMIFALMAVFVGGLMVGRTPEYLGKKLEPFEMKMLMAGMLALTISILVFTGIAAASRAGTESILNPGPHGLTEIFFAYSSAGSNNGAAFSGLNSNTDFYNYTIGIAIFAGRYLVLFPMLAVGGSMARKERLPATLGTLPTDGPLYIALVIGIILVVGALSFFPALALGPIVEHLLL